MLARNVETYWSRTIVTDFPSFLVQKITVLVGRDPLPLFAADSNRASEPRMTEQARTMAAKTSVSLKTVATDEIICTGSAAHSYYAWWPADALATSDTCFLARDWNSTVASR